MAVSLRLFGAAALAALFCASQASDSAPDMEKNASGRRVLIRTAKPDGSVDAGIGDLVDNGDAGVEVTPSGEAVLDFGSERGDSSRPGKHHKHHTHHKHRKHGQRHGHGHSHGHEDRKREHPHHGRPSRSGGDDRSSEGQDRHKDVRRGGEEGEEEDSHHGGSFVEVGDMDNSEGLRANFHVDQVATSGGSTTQAASGGRFREDDDDSADRDAEGDDDIKEGGDSDDEKDLALQDTANANEKEEGHEKHHDHDHHGNSTAAGLDATLEREVRDAFAIYDVDKTGFLDAKELKTLIKHTGISRDLPAVKWLWNEYDNNKDGKLSVGEVLKMAKDHEDSGASFDEEDSSLTEGGGDEEGGYEEEGDSDEDYDLSSLTHEYVTEQFKKHDKDSSGFLEGDEMFALLKENGVDDPEWEDVDSDGDKRMSFEELVTLAGLDEHTS